MWSDPNRDLYREVRRKPVTDCRVRESCGDIGTTGQSAGSVVGAEPAEWLDDDVDSTVVAGSSSWSAVEESVVPAEIVVKDEYLGDGALPGDVVNTCRYSRMGWSR